MIMKQSNLIHVIMALIVWFPKLLNIGIAKEFYGHCSDIGRYKRCSYLFRCWMYREFPASRGISFVAGTWSSCRLQLGKYVSPWCGESIFIILHYVLLLNFSLKLLFVGSSINFEFELETNWQGHAISL